MPEANKSPEKIACLIIGSGPAGYTAAIYAARANLAPVLISGYQPGGQLTTTTDVENFPGYPEGVMGPQMMKDLEEQARRMGTDLRWGSVSKVDLNVRPFKVEIDEESWLEAESLIIATGASAKWLGLDSEQRLSGFGVSACAVCDGFFFKGKEVSIVGGGDTACEDALYLSKICSKVHMFVRRDVLRASKIMQERVFEAENIQIYWNTEAEEVLGDKTVTGVRIINNQTQKKQEIPISAFFVAIGHTPNSGLFKEWLNMDSNGYIITQPGSTKTNVEGVFACGDVQDHVYRQAVTAAGTGCMAALDAERYLSVLEHERKAQSKVNA